MRAGAGVLVALCVCAASTAHADNKAWTAAKKTLSGGEQLVMVANFAAIRDSQLFQTVWPAFLKNHKDASDMLGKTKETCGFDAISAIDSIVFAVPTVDNSDAATFVISLKVAQKDVDSCFSKLEKAETGKTVKISTAGGITTYDTGAEQLYMRWIDKTTLAFSAAGKENLMKMTGGGLSGDKTLGAGIKGIKADSALSFIYGGQIPLDQIGAHANLVYGSATVASGNLGADVHIVVDNAKSAADATQKFNSQLDAAKKAGGIPPMVDSLVKSLVVKASGSEIVLTASAPEKDVLTLANMAMAGGGP